MEKLVSLSDKLAALCLKHSCRDLNELRVYYANHFFEFTCEVLEYKDLMEIPHREICDYIAYAKGDGSSRTSNTNDWDLKVEDDRGSSIRRIGLFVPRDSFKTTIAAISFPIWKWCFNPALKFLIVSATSPKAEDILQEVKNQLEKNRILTTLYGEMGKAAQESGNPAATWKGDSIQIFDPLANEGEGDYVPFRNMNSARAMGIEGNYTGKHPDYILADDTVVEQNARSADQLQRVKQFFRAIEPLLKEGSCLLTSGTFYHFEDAYSEQIKNKACDLFIRSVRNRDGSLWFPERLTENYLRDKEIAMGSIDFAGQYLMCPINPKDANFKGEWVDMAIQPSCNIPREELTVIGVLDPAAGGAMGTQKKVLDNTAILILAQDLQENTWVLHEDECKLSPIELADKLLAYNREWKLEELCGESVGFQVYVQPVIELRAKELEETIYFKPIKQTTRQSKNHRITARLVPRMQAGKVKILNSCRGLIGELRRFDASRTRNKDNLLDCLEMGIRELVPPASKPHEYTELEIQAAVKNKKINDLTAEFFSEEQAEPEFATVFG